MGAHFRATMELYDNLRNSGMRKEDARAVLPNNIETYIVTSGFTDAWQHYFYLRTAKDAQEEIRLTAIAAQGLWEINDVLHSGENSNS